MIGSSNSQARYWCEDPAQCEKFLAKVEPRIAGVAKHASKRHHVEPYQKDIVSEIESDFLQLMHDKNIPLAEASPEKAAGFFLDEKNFWILNRGRSIARRIARKQSKEQPTQAEILADVRQPDLPPEIENQLRDTAASIPRLVSAMPNFTSRDSDIYGKETLRQIGIDDLSTAMFDEVAQIAGVSSSEQREYNKYHDENGKNSESDRKAWSRAKDKVKKAFTKGNFTSLLGIVIFLALLFTFVSREDADHQKAFVSREDADHQKAFVSQDRPVYLMALLKEHQ